MFDVTNFLMRWLFLSNLVRDIAEIQTLPYNPNVPQSTSANSHSDYNVGYNHQSPSQLPSLSTATSVSCEDEWKDQCLRGILSYPPGTQRLLIMDAMRAELVERLSWSLEEADLTLEHHELYRQGIHNNSLQNSPSQEVGSFGNAEVEGQDDDEIKQEDPSANVNVRIKNSGKEASDDIIKPPTSTPDETETEVDILSKEVNNKKEDNVPKPTAEEVEDAKNTIRVVRDYLPQLVSIVLKSPPAFDPKLVNPVEKLRRLIIRRCVDDANWGVDMCWLLEAEVGRAWKSLFEHRQQTGRRLIIVLPADKAAVLATIGSGKRDAFDLLQDAEQATAFGYTIPFEDSLFYQDPHQHHRYHLDQVPQKRKLPSSLSLRRCSHFGDTMHFIDRLTKISLDMRGVPVVHRNDYLQDSLREINRRIRRRMITRGDVSLDVEDHRGPNDWPLISDVTLDMLMHSVHLPVDPKVSILVF